MLDVDGQRLAVLRALHEFDATSAPGGGLARARRELQYQRLEHYDHEPPRWKLALRARTGGRRPGAPDFCLVSPPGAGRNACASLVLQHPCVLLPLCREPRLRRVDGASNPCFPTAAERRAVARRHGQALLGLYLARVPDLALPRYLERWNAAMKVVLLLRDPVERARAQWAADLERARAGTGSDVAIRAGLTDLSRVARQELAAARAGALGFASPLRGGPGYVQSGLYTAFTRELLRRFAAGVVLVVRTEDLLARPEAAAARIFEFLGLPACALVDPGRFVAQPPGAPLDDETHAALSEFYAPHNAALYRLIERDMEWS